MIIGRLRVEKDSLLGQLGGDSMSTRRQLFRRHYLRGRMISLRSNSYATPHLSKKPSRRVSTEHQQPLPQNCGEVMRTTWWVVATQNHGLVPQNYTLTLRSDLENWQAQQ